MTVHLPVSMGALCHVWAPQALWHPVSGRTVQCCQVEPQDTWPASLCSFVSACLSEGAWPAQPGQRKGLSSGQFFFKGARQESVLATPGFVLRTLGRHLSDITSVIGCW